MRTSLTKTVRFRGEKWRDGATNKRMTIPFSLNEIEFPQPIYVLIRSATLRGTRRIHWSSTALQLIYNKGQRRQEIFFLIFFSKKNLAPLFKGYWQAVSMYQTEHKYMRKTQIEITDVSPEKISFVLKNTDLSFANALRRYSKDLHMPVYLK